MHLRQSHLVWRLSCKASVAFSSTVNGCRSISTTSMITTTHGLKGQFSSRRVFLEISASLANRLKGLSMNAFMLASDSQSVLQWVDSDLELVQERLSMELARFGFDKEYEPNEYGRLLESLIDVIANERIRRGSGSSL